MSDFEKYWYQEGNEEIKIQYARRIFTGEQVLRIEVDGVHIPYEEAQYPSSRGGSLHPLPPEKGRTCFLAETGVLVDGKLVKIQNVTASRTVSKLEKHEGTFVCRDIVLSTGNKISVVQAHCFMTDSGQWVNAQNLTTDLRLKTLTGNVGIKSITTRSYTGKVYSLKIAGSDQ